MEGLQTSFSLLGMWGTMNWVAKGVVIVLALMSIWSLTIAIERLYRFQKAKHESLQIAKGVTPLLAQHKLRDAIALTADTRYSHSHLARVLRAGLQEFEYETTQSLPDDFDIVASGQRAIERETLMTTAEMKKVLATWRRSPRPRRSSDCSAPSPASSTRSREWRSPDRADLAQSRQVSPKRWSPPRSASSWPFRRSGSTTTS